MKNKAIILLGCLVFSILLYVLFNIISDSSVLYIWGSIIIPSIEMGVFYKKVYKRGTEDSFSGLTALSMGLLHAFLLAVNIKGILWPSILLTTLLFSAIAYLFIKIGEAFVKDKKGCRETYKQGGVIMNSEIISRPIIVKSMIEIDDYAKVNKTISKMVNNGGVWITFYVIFIIVFMGNSFFNGINENSNIQPQPYVPDDTPPIPLFGIILMELAVIGICFFIFYLFKKIMPKRQYKRNKLLQEEAQFTFNESGIEYKTENLLSIIKWEAIFKVYNSRELFYIPLSDRTGWVIMKKKINASDLTSLEDIFNAKIGREKVVNVNY